MKKNIITPLVFVLLCLSIKAQIPNWQWSESIVGFASNGSSTGSCSDANGNAFVTGNFRGPTIAFSSVTLTNTTSNGNILDMFIAKYDAAGNILWANNARGSASDYGAAVATDAAGNVFVTGAFSSTTIVFGTTTLNTTGNTDVFVAKYDPSGSLLWAQKFGGTSIDISTCIGTDVTGNVFIAGAYSSNTVAFGSTTLTRSGAYDIFIAKFDAAGNPSWAKGIGTPNSEYATALGVDGTGNVLLGGYFNGSSLTFVGTPLINADNSGTTSDIFTAKYDPSGNAMWAKRAGGTANDYCTGLSVDATGNAFTTGTLYSSTVTFGTMTLTNVGAPVSTSDIYVAKYDILGNELWAKSVGGPALDFGTGISTDSGGNVFATGTFYSTSIAFGTTTLTSTGSSDIFVAMYDGSGAEIWAKSEGGTFGDYSNSISVGGGDEVLITGYFYSHNFTLAGNTLVKADTAAATLGIFVAKLNSSNTSIKSETRAKDVKIFPNPFSTAVTVESDEPFVNAAIMVDNYIGQTVKQISNVSGISVNIDRGDLPKGLYFLTLKENGKTTLTEKLIISD